MEVIIMFLKLRSLPLFLLLAALLLVGCQTVSDGDGAPSESLLTVEAIWPPDGESVDPSPILQWAAFPGADHYQIVVLDDDAFPPEVIYDESTTDTLFSVTQPLEPGSYSWTVFARNANDDDLAQSGRQFWVQAGQIANPASENCVRQGGTLLIQERGDGGQFGVCLFEDNRQCEEWALLRGDCPVGGRKITGYVSLAAQYCAITGGEYQITGNGNTDQEQGTCTFKNGQTCDVWDYFAGQCNPNPEAGQSSYNDPFTYCAAVGTIDTPDERYTGDEMPASVIQGLIQQGIVSADAPLAFQQNAVWRCMANSVWVCHFGANLPCLEKADTAQTPAAAMDEYCEANPTVAAIPAAVTGRATVYEWRCTDGKPEVGRQLFTADPQGYLAEFWYELIP
jgi:putative hemolysin